jgi:hypothetical protein
MELSPDERPRIYAATRRSRIGAICVALISVVAGSCGLNWVPDLSTKQAADIIARAPEFNRYARLVKIEGIYHQKDSMDSVCLGKFTFLYLSSPVDAPPIQANVDFRYHEGKSYLNGFDYGCPLDCHIVDVHDAPRER